MFLIPANGQRANGLNLLVREHFSTTKNAAIGQKMRVFNQF
jgi:hypothetical protein